MRFARYGSAVTAGLIVYFVLFNQAFGLALLNKATGGHEPCEWLQLMKVPWASARFVELQESTLKRLIPRQVDPLGIQLFATPTREFWIKREGSDKDGKHLLAYVIAEQQWISELAPGRGVKAGDLVVDVGAHVGTFGDDALRLGASKVIMVEPDPTNVECLRRNFRAEIATGRVIVVPEGAWSKTATLKFAVGVANSGTGSLVVDVGATQSIEVPVRRLDEILSSVGIDRVDFIKMDIEGAEREALKGASAVLSKWKPRLMLDSYHLTDDDVVLPAIITAANAGYAPYCAVCASTNREESGRFIPYAVFYQ